MAGTPLLLLGLLLCVSAISAVDIAKEYGYCPKYVIKMGDTLFELAKDLNVTQDSLTAAAEGCGADIALLQIDQQICLPGYNDTICKHVLETDPDRPWCQVYEVQPGDTVTSIASILGITQRQLINLNADYLQDGSSKPYAGQYLRIPGWDQELCRDFNDNDAPKCRIYTVQQGDSLADITQKFKVGLQDTLDLNNLTSSATLEPNSKLKLPEWNETCPPEGIPAELPADTVACRVTQLQDGESLAILAVQYQTTGQAVMAVNPTLKNVTLLQPGIYVNLPPFPPTCVGKGNLVDVPGQTTVPNTYDYNGLVPSSDAAPPAAEAPTLAPVEAPTEAPAAAPTPAPSPPPSPKPAPKPSPSPSPSPSPVPAPAPAPTTSAAMPAAATTLLAALVTVLAGALLF